jgi:ABC-2 type transport system permease protein
VDAFLATIVSMLGMIASLYAVQASLRMRSEETAIRVEPLLSTAVGRLRWASSHLVFALFGSGVILAAGGLLAGLLHGLRIGDVSGQLPALLGAALAQLPAVWVVAGMSVLLFGFLPKYSAGAWGVAAFLLLIGLFGPPCSSVRRFWTCRRSRTSRSCRAPRSPPPQCSGCWESPCSRLVWASPVSTGAISGS